MVRMEIVGIREGGKGLVVVVDLVEGVIGKGVEEVNGGGLS